MVEKTYPIYTTNYSNKGKYAVIKLWLKEHNVEFEEKTNCASFSSWTSMNYQLTLDQMGELYAFLAKAEVLYNGYKIII